MIRKGTSFTGVVPKIVFGLLGLYLFYTTKGINTLLEGLCTDVSRKVLKFVIAMLDSFLSRCHAFRPSACSCKKQRAALCSFAGVKNSTGRSGEFVWTDMDGDFQLIDGSRPPPELWSTGKMVLLL